MAALSPNFDPQFFDGGAPAAGYLLHTYATGTTTPLTSYQDEAETIPNTNPIVLDASGRAKLRMVDSAEYRLHLTTPLGATVSGYPIDDVGGVSTAIDDAALRAELASTAAGKGSAMVGVEGGGTAQDAIDAYVYAGSGTDDTAALSARDAAAAAAGKSLILKGAITVSSAITFSAFVRPSPGSRITATGAGGGTKWLKFAAGVDAGLQYWLDTDWPTQFLETEKIYPQWFGSCGGVSEDSTIPMMRAYRAARACSASATATPDKSYGCRTVYFTPGVYQAANVVVYCGTITRGEWQGSLFGSTIKQLVRTSPVFLVVPKNYGLNDSVLNDGVGQNYFDHIGFKGLANFASGGDTLIKFLSSAQATTYLGIAGDFSGTVNHVDTMFSHSWFKDAPTCLYCDDGTFHVHIRDSVFDVVERAVYHGGTSRGSIKSYDNFYYGCIWGAFVNEITGASDRVTWESYGDDFIAGNSQEATATRTRALMYFPANVVAGSRVIVKSRFRSTTGLFGSRIGGIIYMRNAEWVDLDVNLDDPDNLLGTTKAIAISEGVKYLQIRGSILSKTLLSYTNARLIGISQSTPTLASIKIDMALTNENATAISAGVYSDFSLANVDLTGTVLRGTFTQEVESTISRPWGYARKGTATYDPPSIAAGGTATTTVNVVGARLGDFAEASFSLSLAGLTLTAYVSASDTVTVVLHNPTGSAIDLVSGTLSALAQRRV